MGLQVGASNLSLLREKLGFVSSLLILGHHAGDGLYGRLCLSYLFCCGVILLHLRCRSCSASFLISSEGFVLYVAVDSVYPWEEVSSGFFYIAVLSWNIFLMEDGKNA